MKRPNWKLYILIGKIELILVFLSLIGVFILFLLLLDSTFPTFKYSLLYFNLISYIVLIISTIILIAVIIKWRKKFLNTILPKQKIIYSLSCMILSFILLSSVEYLIYINRQTILNIENSYIKSSIIDKVNDINKEIIYCKEQTNKYNRIYEGLKGKEHIGYSNVDDSYFTIIHDDTVEIKINKKRTIGAGSIGINIDFGLDDAHDIGISLKNERYNISHPSSKAILESMKRNDSINVNDLRILINQKIDRYDNRIKEYKTILENELVITFGDFIIYNLFNSNITGNKTHIIIRLIFYLQAIVITFFSGYIYQTLYKMLDWKESNN